MARPGFGQDIRLGEVLGGADGGRAGYAEATMLHL